MVVGYALPGALALLRFRRLSAYHTWSAKLAVALLAPRPRDELPTVFHALAAFRSRGSGGVP